MTVSMQPTSERVSAELQTKLNRQLSLIIETQSIYESNNGSSSSSPGNGNNKLITYALDSCDSPGKCNNKTESTENRADDGGEESDDSDEPLEYMLMSVAARLPENERATLLEKARRREDKYDRLRRQSEEARELLRESPTSQSFPVVEDVIHPDTEATSVGTALAKDATEPAGEVVKEPPSEASASSPSSASTAARRKSQGGLLGTPPPVAQESLRIAPPRKSSSPGCPPPPEQLAPSMPCLPSPRVWQDDDPADRRKQEVIVETGADRLAAIRRNRQSERSCCRLRPSFSMILACCGLMYSLHGQKSLLVERLGFGDLLSERLGLSTLTLSRTSVGGFNLGRLEKSMPEFVFTGSAENSTAEIEYLEAAVERSRARSDARRRDLETLTRAALFVGMCVTLLVLLFALSCWRHIMGALIAVAAGAVVFIVAIIAADLLRKR